jgi:hypothetical protein
MQFLPLLIGQNAAQAHGHLGDGTRHFGARVG